MLRVLYYDNAGFCTVSCCRVSGWVIECHFEIYLFLDQYVTRQTNHTSTTSPNHQLNMDYSEGYRFGKLIMASEGYTKSANGTMKSNRASRLGKQATKRATTASTSANAPPPPPSPPSDDSSIDNAVN